jgi:lysozyme
MRLRLALLLPLLIVAGCAGSHPSPPRLHSAATTYTPPESARTPEGLLNPSPPKPQAPPVTPPRPTAPVKHIDTAGLHLIEGFEGFSSCPYQDVTGVWTIGFGEAFVSPSTPCESRATAEGKLRWLIERDYEWAIRALGVPLTQHEWDALCSFSYNLGSDIFLGTTVGADLRARRYFPATRIMLEYDHVGSVVLPGLRIRREAEVRLFLTPEPEPKPAPLSPAEKRRLVAYWTRERNQTLAIYHRYCTARSTGPKCTAWRQREHALYRDIVGLR